MAVADRYPETKVGEDGRTWAWFTVPLPSGRIASLWMPNPLTEREAALISAQLELLRAALFGQGCDIHIPPVEPQTASEDGGSRLGGSTEPKAECPNKEPDALAEKNVGGSQ